MAIHPYLVVRGRSRSARCAAARRPIRPRTPKSSVRRRLVGDALFPVLLPIERLTPSMLARFTQVDYDREWRRWPPRVWRDAEHRGVARYIMSPAANPPSSQGCG
jgi:hypothetical protein